MTIRWRLAIATAQLLILVVGARMALSGFPAGETWFLSGLLAIIVNRQLLEPFYSRPADVLANSVVAVAIWLGADRARVEAGWNLLLAVYVLAASVALLALILGAGREGAGARFGNAAAIVSYRVSPQIIFSGLFFVALLDVEDPAERTFWEITGIWLAVMAVGSLPLHRIWVGLSSSGEPVSVVGLIGPTRLLVNARATPPIGDVLTVEGAGVSADAVVVSRVKRSSDVWAELQLGDAGDAEKLLTARTVTTKSRGADKGFVGVVDEGSTVDRLSFMSAAELQLGDVVSVDIGPGPVLFQVVEARLERINVKRGTQIVIRVAANQLGRFDSATCRMARHSWVAQPGAIVRVPDLDPENLDPSDDLLRLGHISNTSIPVFIDLSVLCEGHAAILGMTKMGKTTLAHRVATAVADSRKTVIIDGTGEYRTKLGVAEFDKDKPWTDPSLSVLEPPDGTIGADYALKCVERLREIASEEYAIGNPTPRSLLFEEAHDYFPEPASLGFGAPGRDASYQLGLRMMQIRKYGLSFVLVSQRTAVVSKSALSQCENLIVFRSVDRTGLDYLEDVSGSNVRKLIPSLSQGQAVVFGPAVSADAPVAIDVELLLPGEEGQ